MAVAPFAVKRLIPPGSNDPRIKARVVILHVAVSMADSLFNYFNGPSGGIESHFYINWRGKIEQYRDTDFEADANYRANPFAISIETAGWAGGRWNLLQRRAIRRLLKWAHGVHDIPLQKCPRWDGAGVGYHVQFGAPGAWTNVSKSCPGPARIAQFDNWLVPWMRKQSVHYTRGGSVDHALEDLADTKGGKHRMRVIKAAIELLSKQLKPWRQK